MRIAFYAPFKPLDHANPSGDLMIGRAIFAFLEERGHAVSVISQLRSRWIFHHPLRMLQTLLEQRRISALLRSNPVDLWLSYHSYYKAPDLLGPAVCRRLQIPYVIIQPSYGTRVRRSWTSKAGFYLNRRALLAADMLITDRERDWHNLQRIIEPRRLGRIRPGLDPQQFTFDHQSRQRLRNTWSAGSRPVILAAAMFRSDVKTRSLVRLIESCIRLRENGQNFLLVLVGDGPEKNLLQKVAAPLPAKDVIFAGQVARSEMYRYYSATDIFAFPGINESLGMVFLEAQSCGLPVIACNNGGIPEVVRDGETGLLTSLEDDEDFDRAILSLINEPQMRKKMGQAGAEYVRTSHDLRINYLQMEDILIRTATEPEQL